MNKNFSRQLKDIQNEADKLIHGKPSLMDIKNFQKYSDEMVNYIRKYTDDPNVLAKVSEIPKIIELKDDSKSSLVTFLISGPWGFLFRETQKINEALSIVNEVKSIYSSISFLQGKD